MLPPLELYRVRLPRERRGRQCAVTEYYVVDGRHRMAMARKLRQDFLDAHVADYRAAGLPAGSYPPPAAPARP